MGRAKKEQGTSKDSPLQMSASVVAMAAPNINKVSFKSVAGLSEEELIQRNVIADLNEDEELKGNDK